MTLPAYTKLTAGIAILIALAFGYVLLQQTDALDVLLDGDALQRRILRLGVWGPAAIIALMAVAVMVSPIPSAPIAVAAGAAYGHGWGTLYVLLGAEVGAIGAFFIARLVGYDILHRLLGDRLSTGWLGSQRTLMSVVFLSRLLPFVSFDLVSYAAGLTALSFWRFAAATFAGIIPASFLLAHFGGEMATGQAEQVMIAVAALGIITLIPLLVRFFGGRLPDWFMRKDRRSQSNRQTAPLVENRASDSDGCATSKIDGDV